MDIQEIQEAIESLESGDTNFETCEKLAILYIVRNFHPDYELDEVIQEYNDILPSYDKYCKVKRDYQMGVNNDVEALSKSLDLVCKEIREFLEKLYSGTDSQAERDCIINMLKQFLDTIG